MKTIPAQEIKRRGISAVDELLQDGPVEVIKHNRPRYVVMTVDGYRRLARGQTEPAAGASAWDWLDKPAADRAHAARSKADIDAALAREREAWDGTGAGAGDADG
jgi:PHD/YefM family antitoxin component YafN of YafNO toxin-antitoxin module